MNVKLGRRFGLCGLGVAATLALGISVLAEQDVHRPSAREGGGLDVPQVVAVFPEEVAKTREQQRLVALNELIRKSRIFPSSDITNAALDPSLDGYARAYFAKLIVEQGADDDILKLGELLAQLSTESPAFDVVVNEANSEAVYARWMDEKPLHEYFANVSDCIFNRLPETAREQMLSAVIFRHMNGVELSQAAMWRLAALPDKKYASKTASDALVKNRIGSAEAAVLAGAVVSETADIDALGQELMKRIRSDEFMGRRPFLMWALAATETTRAEELLLNAQRLLLADKAYKPIDQRWVQAVSAVASDGIGFIRIRSQPEELLDYATRVDKVSVGPLQVRALRRALDSGLDTDVAKERVTAMWNTMNADSSTRLAVLQGNDQWIEDQMTLGRFWLLAPMAVELGVVEFQNVELLRHGPRCTCGSSAYP